MKSDKLTSSDQKARPRPNTFYGPNPNRLVIRLAQTFIRSSIRRKLKVHEISISDEDLERLRRLKGQRCLLTPSHSGGFEPHIMMYVSKLLDDFYNYIAAIELFERSWINRWVLPRLGVYSIVRGAVDRPSFTMTRKLLAEGKRWLVVFPEGETIWQNSTLIPFQDGVIQLAFKGYKDACESHEDAHLFCVPIAIKYVYTKDMHKEIDASLTHLEKKLGIETEDQTNRLGRLRAVAESVLTALENSYQIKTDSEATLNERAAFVKEKLVSRLEEQLGVKPRKQAALLDRVRILFNTLDRIVEVDSEGSEYEQQLAAERQSQVIQYYEDLTRLVRFIAIHDGYVSDSITFERFLDVLSQLEMEVHKHRTMWGPRKAIIKVGDPVDLKDHAEAYDQNRRKTVSELTLGLESSVRSMLDELGEDCKTVETISDGC